MTIQEVEEDIKEYEKRTGITLDANNKATLRNMLLNGSMQDRDDRFWENYIAMEERTNNNNSHDDQ